MKLGRAAKIWVTVAALGGLLWLTGCDPAAEAQLRETRARIASLETEVTTVRTAQAEQDRELTTQRAALRRAEADLATAQAQLTTAQAELAQAKADLAERDAALAGLRDSLTALREADATEYARLQKLVEDKQYADALTGLATFVQRYPNSGLMVEARRLQSRARAEQTRAQQAEARARAAETAALRQQELIARLRSGQVTLDELRPRLLNQPEAQVRALLGEPAETYTGNQWRYRDAVLDPSRGMPVSLKVTFTNGVVTEVDLWTR